MIWTWLWGPLGLVLATPLSVCMVVLGQHVPELSFFTRLMVDDRVVDPSLQLYHRLVAQDEEDAFVHVARHIDASGWSQTVDNVILPALAAAKQDHARGILDHREAERIIEAIDGLVDQHCPSLPDGDASFKHLVLVCPAHGLLDSAALKLAKHTLENNHQACDVENLSDHLLSSEVAGKIAERKPMVVVVASLPSGDITYLRKWCGLVKRWCPGVHIIAARLGAGKNFKDSGIDALLEAGASSVVSSIGELWLAITPRFGLKANSAS